MSQNILQEVSRRSFNLIKYDETQLSWRHSMLAVRTYKGVNIYELAHNLECTDKKLDLIESSILTNKASPATRLFSSTFIKYELPNVELTQMIVDPAFWPHNPDLVREMTITQSCQWSPLDVLHKNAPLIAIMNNIGNVDLYQSIRGTWVNVLDVSKCVSEQFDVPKPRNMAELTESVLLLESCAMCWGSKANKDGSFYFVTAQKNGNILLWCLSEGEAELNAKYCGCLESNLGDVVSILWFNQHNDTFLLIISNLEGVITALECKVDDCIKLLKTHTLWPHKDRMAAQYIQYTVIDNKLILLCNKHRHLLALMLDENCNVIAQYVNNVNDYKLTGITNCLDGFFVCTMNCKIYKINIKVINNDLNVTLDSVEIKDTYSNCELYGLSMSDNCVIHALALMDRKLCHKKGQPKVNIVFLAKNMNEITEISYLLNNQPKALANAWDHIELFRLKTMKLKILPKVDLNQLVEDGNTDIYKLKVYLLIATLWTTLEKNVAVFRGSLPMSVEAVQDRIMLSQGVLEMTKLYNQIKSGCHLNDFEIKTFIGTRMFIEFYSNKYKKQLNEIISSDILQCIDCHHSYVCQCCDDTLDGFKCRSGHLNMFCSLTFTPIEGENYLICKSCGITARDELYKSKAKCIFCDQYLELL